MKNEVLTDLRAGQGRFTLINGRERAGLLPSPCGRGVGGEGSRSRNLPASGPTVVLPSPQTPLPVGEGLYPAQCERVLPVGGPVLNPLQK